MHPWAWGSVPLDVLERGEDIIVRASLPGIDPKDIDATLDGNVLTIKGQTEAETEAKDAGYLLRERRTGAFQRILRLPNVVDTEKVSTRYEAGVLTVTFPKLEVKKAKQLKGGRRLRRQSAEPNARRPGLFRGALFFAVRWVPRADSLPALPPRSRHGSDCSLCGR